MEAIKEEIVKHSQKVWFIFLVGFLHWADTFILVVPNDFLVVAAVVAQPKRWLLMAIVQTLGCLAGCLSFCALALYNPDGVKNRYPSLFESDTWQQTQSAFESYGMFASFLLGGILPIHPFLIVGAFSGMSIPMLVGSITLGRFIRNFLLCLTTVKGTSISLFGASDKKQRKKK